MKKFTNEYWDSIKKAVELINNADRILIGVGAGLTASGGLCYTDPVLAQKWYPEYFALGKKSIIDIMSDFWPNTIHENNAITFWGFWAKHIYHIRYEADTLKPYFDLFNITVNKDYFICTTNVDGQLGKAGFNIEKIFAPQGDYALFQCEKPCTQEVYANNSMIKSMLKNMISPLEIQEEDIPRCPRCGSLLMPNLRCDINFVETPHINNVVHYQEFINSSYNKKLLLLELGVGFNTPGIIRYPFEVITYKNANAHLIRINCDDVSVSENISDKAITMKEDAGKVLTDLCNGRGL